MDILAFLVGKLWQKR